MIAIFELALILAVVNLIVGVVSYVLEDVALDRRRLDR